MQSMQVTIYKINASEDLHDFVCNLCKPRSIKYNYASEDLHTHVHGIYAS